jgi:hypothetical protein
VFAIVTRTNGVPWLTPQVQLQFAVDLIDALVVPRVAFDIAKMQKTHPEALGLAGVRQPDQQIGDLFVLGL